MKRGRADLYSSGLSFAASQAGEICGKMRGRNTFLRRLRKIAKSDYERRYVIRSVRMEQLGSQWIKFDI